MKYLSLLVLLFLASYASAQKNVIDKIIAVVGEEIVLKSDIENQFLHEQSQGLVNSSSDSRTRILENLLVQKLLVAQAKIDSIEVTDTEVENALNSQLEQYVQHIGSRERLETYFGKSYEDIKNEMRTPLREQMITQRMQSKIVETEFGFHILQYIDRQGDKVNVRHILLRPRISDEERQEAIQHLDTVLTYIHDGKATFEEAAAYFSMDKKTRNNGGLIFNEEDADSKLPRETIEGEMARQVNKLKVGEISSPFLDQTRTGEEYKVIKIKAYYPSHTANLDDDWISFENGLKSKKQQEVLDKWIKEKQENTYIHIDEDYKNSKFHYDGWFK